MIPATQSDVWKPANETEKIQALVMLSGLPSRATTAGELDNAAYMIALDGVPRYGLQNAVKNILRGSLAHAFMPSPPELRMECDRAMQWYEREVEKIRRDERENAAWRHTHGDVVKQTPEMRARVAELYAEFRKGYEKPEEYERKLDPELVALVPDNPKALARQRMGAK